jgi:hypothetical protein
MGRKESDEMKESEEVKDKDVQRLVAALRNLRKKSPSTPADKFKHPKPLMTSSGKAWCLGAALCAMCFVAQGAKNDDTPRKDGDRTTCRDRYGRIIGVSTTSSCKTTYRNERGVIVATSTASGDKTYYRDINGRSTGSSTTTNSKDNANVKPGTKDKRDGR